MALVLKIGGTDRSSWVKWQTLQKVEVLTKEVDRLEFEIIKTDSKTKPTAGTEVTLEEGGIKIFGGLIVEVLETVRGGVLLGFQVRCKDYSHTLDRKLILKTYENKTAREIILDIVANYTTGFTTAGVATVTPTLSSIKYNYEQITRALTQLADHLGWDWYVDYDKDIHFFNEETYTAPFEITDTNQKIKWRSFEHNQTILQLKNAVYVRGGEYKKTIAEVNAQDVYLGDATRTVFPLQYKYANLSVKKGGVVQIIGTDQQDDPATCDVLLNQKEKFLRFTTAPGAAVEVKSYGDAFIPIIALVRDHISIAAYGIYEAVVVDKSITSVTEAQSRAKSELRKYAESVNEARFLTNETGLRVGQQIKVTLASRSLDKWFKINRIIGKPDTSGRMLYEVFLIASGQTTFTDIMIDLLGKDKKTLEFADNEVLQRLESFYEAVECVDAVSVNKTTPPYKWASSANNLVWGFGTWS
jgi:hypothetical protein